MATLPPIESVCETEAASKSGRIEWRVHPWSALPSEHVVGRALEGRTTSEIMQAAGDKWEIQVMPGGNSKPNDTEAVAQTRKEHVAIFL